MQAHTIGENTFLGYNGRHSIFWEERLEGLK